MKIRHRGLWAALAAAGVGISVVGCSGSGDSADGDVTITLAGPNQWNTQSDSFGPAWEDLIARFKEAEPNITVETTVLPLNSFGDTLSTQLAAGTAPELIFRGTPHTPDQIVALDEYLDEPNPYVDDNERWLDTFNPDYFGDGQRNANGDIEFIPFNTVIAGLFYNTEAFEDAGVDGPPETFEDLIGACTDLKDAGYTPMAMDSGSLGTGWTSETIYAMLLDKYFDEWNVYGVDGEEGQAEGLTGKSMARAILTGELNAQTTPEIAEAVELTKTVYDACATPNWSGIASSASFVGADEFLAGDAAMAWGTNFATSNFDDVDWKWSSFGFPMITTETTELSADVPSRFGAAAGGTNYMIPATTEGPELEAAITFLRFASSPENNQPWIDATGGLPVTADTEPAPGLENLMSSAWAEKKRINLNIRSAASSGKNILEGYLLGSKTLDEQLAALQGEFETWAHESAKNSGWTEDWAKAE